MENKQEINKNPIEPKKGKLSEIGEGIERVIKEKTESRAKKIEGNKDITKLGFVDHLLVKINKFKEGRYDKSIEKLEGKIDSTDKSIKEKEERIKEIASFMEEMKKKNILVNMLQETTNAKNEKGELETKRQALVTKKEVKEGGRNEFIKGRDSIIEPVVLRLKESKAEADKNLKKLEKEEKAWDISIKLARENYKESTENLDDVTRRMDKIMGKSRSREFKNNMKAIEDRREKLKNDMDQKEKDFIDFKRKMEETKEKAENYKNQIGALKGMKGEEKKEVEEGKKSQGEEKVTGGEKGEGTQEKPRAEKWEKMSFKDYVEAWKDFLSLEEKGFSKKSVEDFKKIIIKAELEDADREINFDDFKNKIEYVNNGLKLIKKSDWEKATEDFKGYIKKNKS